MALKGRCDACGELAITVKTRRVNGDGELLSETFVCGICGFEEERIAAS